MNFFIVTRSAVLVLFSAGMGSCWLMYKLYVEANIVYVINILLYLMLVIGGQTYNDGWLWTTIYYIREDIQIMEDTTQQYIVNTKQAYIYKEEGVLHLVELSVSQTGYIMRLFVIWSVRTVHSQIWWSSMLFLPAWVFINYSYSLSMDVASAIHMPMLLYWQFSIPIIYKDVTRNI